MRSGPGGPGNQFTLSGGASFVCAWAQVSGPGNVITISGSNTVWNNHGSLDFGYCCGGSNQLTISAGAVVSNTAVLIGDSIVASNNVVLVAGSNSLWQVNGYFYVTTSGNIITVTNQARVNSSSLTIDNAAPLSQDRSILTVADGSVWSNSGRWTSVIMGPATNLMLKAAPASWETRASSWVTVIVC